MAVDGPALAPMEPALGPMELANRLPRLRVGMGDVGCEGLLVTNATNISYLTGFRGSAGLLLVRADDAVLLTDGRYRSQAAEQLAGAGVEVHVEIGNAAAQKELASAVASDLQRLGLEASHVTWARQRAFAAEWFPRCELVPTDGLVERLRQVKDAGEVTRMGHAARIADEALAAVRPQLVDGISEADVALALDVAMRRLGAEDSAFSTIVASGPNGAKPHARPSDRRVRSGELVVVDFGAVVDGYRSDMTRTLCLGEPASPTLARMVEVVVAAQRAGVGAVRAGRAAAEVDRACRDVITGAGLGEGFVHGTGHGVGLDIHEAPALAPTSGDTLAIGHVVTVEPGVYLPDHGGVRIEDTVVVTDAGCQALTTSPKDVVI